MFCRTCGAPLAEGAAFCRACGTPVAPAAVMPGSPAPPAPLAAPVDATDSATLPMQTAVSPPMPAPGTYVPAGAVQAPVVAASARGHRGLVISLVSVGVVVVLAGAGYLVWTTGLLDKLMPKGGGEVAAGSLASGTATGTASSASGTSGTVLSDADSYKALVTGLTTLRDLNTAYGAPTKGTSTGYLFENWSKVIGSKDRTRALQTQQESADWMTRIKKARDEFSARQLASSYAENKAQLLAVYDLMVERATIYADTSAYAVDNPGSGPNAPWRDVQFGRIGGGRSSKTVQTELDKAINDYRLPPF